MDGSGEPLELAAHVWRAGDHVSLDPPISRELVAVEVDAAHTTFRIGGADNDARRVASGGGPVARSGRDAA